MRALNWTVAPRRTGSARAVSTGMKAPRRRMLTSQKLEGGLARHRARKGGANLSSRFRITAHAHRSQVSGVLAAGDEHTPILYRILAAVRTEIAGGGERKRGRPATRRSAAARPLPGASSQIRDELNAESEAPRKQARGGGEAGATARRRSARVRGAPKLAPTGLSVPSHHDLPPVEATLASAAAGPMTPAVLPPAASHAAVVAAAGGLASSQAHSGMAEAGAGAVNHEDLVAEASSAEVRVRRGAHMQSDVC